MESIGQTHTATEPVLADARVILDMQSHDPRLVRRLLTAPEGYLFMYKGVEYIFKRLTDNKN